MATAPVPSVVGLSRDAALSALTQANLVEGLETRVVSETPVNTVTRTIPVAGTQVPQGSKVDVDVSVGSRRQKWWENTSSFIFSVLGIMTLLTLLIVLVVSLLSHGPLEELGNLENARGLITFLIAFTTVGIAIILTISAVVAQDSPENDKRFDRGKQVLTTLIGVLGTIVGFYFAGIQGAGTPASSPAITSAALPSGNVGTKYADTQLLETGGTPPFKWKADGLPKGLLLGDNGVLSGTPTEEVDGKAVKFTVTDKNSKSDTKEMRITIAPAQSSQQAPKGP